MGNFIEEDLLSEPTLDSISGFSSTFILNLNKARNLIHGENPHQKAAVYGRFFDIFQQIQGPEPSLVTVLNITQAAYLMGEFEKATVALLVNANPFYVCSTQDFNVVIDGMEGAVCVVNRSIDVAFARQVFGKKLEAIVAPEYAPEALEVLSLCPHIALFRAKLILDPSSMQEIESVPGGILVQDRDFKPATYGAFQVVTHRQPSAEEWSDLMFSWRVAKYSTSKAAVFSKGETTIAIGSSQFCPQDAIHVADYRAKKVGLAIKGAVVAFDDRVGDVNVLDFLKDLGVTAIVQPGCNSNDPLFIEYANNLGFTMLFSGRSHIKL